MNSKFEPCKASAIQLPRFANWKALLSLLHLASTAAAWPLLSAAAAATTHMLKLLGTSEPGVSILRYVGRNLPRKNSYFQLIFSTAGALVGLDF